MSKRRHKCLLSSDPQLTTSQATPFTTNSDFVTWERPVCLSVVLSSSCMCQDCINASRRGCHEHLVGLFMLLVVLAEVTVQLHKLEMALRAFDASIIITPHCMATSTTPYSASNPCIFSASNSSSPVRGF